VNAINAEVYGYQPAGTLKLSQAAQ
jgi:hypothetical protein